MDKVGLLDRGEQMEEKVAWVKMQGCGNDYIFLNCIRHTGLVRLVGNAGFIRAICDRHYGVGADGVVWVLPYSGVGDANVDGEMRMFNADGSEGNMCGNAIRCVAEILWQEFGKEMTVILTKSGLRRVRRIECTPAGGAESGEHRVERIDSERCGDYSEIGEDCTDILTKSGIRRVQRISELRGENGGKSGILAHFLDNSGVLYEVEMGRTEVEKKRVGGRLGYLVDVGNRHWVCFSKRVSLERLVRQARRACRTDRHALQESESEDGLGMNIEKCRVLEMPNSGKAGKELSRYLDRTRGQKWQKRGKNAEKTAKSVEICNGVFGEGDFGQFLRKVEVKSGQKGRENCEKSADCEQGQRVAEKGEQGVGNKQGQRKAQEKNGADGKSECWVVRAEVWERGSGRTLACGTGAVAVASAVWARYGKSEKSPIRVLVGMPGGWLLVCGKEKEWTLTGPAEVVASGEFVWRGCEV